MTSRRPLPGRPDVPLARLFFQRLIYESTRGALGLPRRLAQSCFHPRVCDLFRSVFPRCLATSSSSRRIHSSSEFLRLVSSLGSPFGPSFTSPRFMPSSRLHPRAATIRQRSQPLASFRPRAFSAPRRFSPRSGSQACFIPLPRPGSRSFRGFSRRAATLARREEPAPLPLAHESLTCLRRLPQLMRLDFEAFIRTGPRSLPHTLFTCAGVAPLLESLSLRPSLLSVSPAYPVLSARDVGSSGLRFRARPPCSSSASCPPEV
jgi:hypothetical protein